MSRPVVRILVLCLIGLGLIAYALQRQRSFEIDPGSTVVLEISGSYVEAPGTPLLARLSGGSAAPFATLLSRLAMLERDDRVGTVVLHLRTLDVGWGKAQEVRAGVTRLREAGRKVIAFLEPTSFSPNLEYYVASAADEIYVPPGTALPMVGLAAEHLYLGGLFEKVGVDIEVAKVGRFKSAAESLAETEMSEAARLQANALLDSTYEQFVRGIAEGRGLEEDAVRRAIDSGPTRASELVHVSFIDGEQHLSELLEQVGADWVAHDDYGLVAPEDVGFDPVAEFALVYGTGTVVSGSGSRTPSGEPVFASETVSDALKEAAEDERFSAIILRIDSPGGSALASEIIWKALQDARELDKPIIASFSDVAASGGYYVAAGADAIVAPPLSITGSIGVFALRPVVGGLMDELGINVFPLTRGEHADFYLSSEPLSEGASDRMQGLVEETYDLFLDRVAEGRGMERDAVHEVAQGRVWTAAQAREVGLVDELGGLRDALNLARERAGLTPDDDVALVPYPPAPTLAQQLAELLQTRWAVGWPGGAASVLAEAGMPTARALRDLERFVADLPLGRPLAIAPVLPDIR